MDYAMNFAWDNDRRAFWTQRKKTATSLVAVLSMMAGLAVAYKLFDTTIPNNVVRDANTFDYGVYKQEAAAGDADWQDTGTGIPVFAGGVDQYPGDKRDVDLKIVNTNTPERDASFQVYVDQDITVVGCVSAAGDPIGVDDQGNCEAGATTTTPTALDPGLNIHANFVSLWSLVIDKQRVANIAGNDIVEDDHRGQNVVGETLAPGSGNPDNSQNRQYRSNPADPSDPANDPNASACYGGLRELIDAAPCDLGVVKAAGSKDTLGEATDQRHYIFGLRELDDATDQSGFKGWALDFSLVFQARVPALPEPEGL